jgi:hypothetical protein
MFPQWPRLTHATYLSLSLTHTQLDISNCDTFKIEYCSSHAPISSSFFIINSLSILFVSRSLFFRFHSLSLTLYVYVLYSRFLSVSVSLALSLLALGAESHGHCGHVCNEGCVLKARQELVLGDQGFEHAVGDELEIGERLVRHRRGQQQPANPCFYLLSLIRVTVGCQHWPPHHLPRNRTAKLRRDGVTRARSSHARSGTSAHRCRSSGGG